MSKWYVLARLAELVERGDAKLEKLEVPSWSKDNDIFIVRANYDPQIEAGLSDEEEVAICETLSTRFMERALALGLKGPSPHGDCKSEHRCVTCGAEPGNWCRSTHAGERDSGGWIHPGRETGGSHIGPMPDAKHVQDAMHRFRRMEFETKWQKQRALAKIVDAAGQHHVDVDFLLSDVTPILPRAQRYPDHATGEELDALAHTMYGFTRGVDESDDQLRERIMRFLTEP